jgi:hypothetical protein
MRFWLSGPRIFGIRPGISFTPNELLRRPSPRRQLQGSGSFIYVISGDRGLIKIGVSANPTARLAQLQTSTPSRLSLIYVGALRCSGYAIEAEAHRTLAGYRQNGEWFNVPPDLAIAAVCAAAFRLREPIASVDPRLADEIARMAQPGINLDQKPNIILRAAVVICKGIAGVIFAGIAAFSFFVLWTIIADAI